MINDAINLNVIVINEIIFFVIILRKCRNEMIIYNVYPILL